jgi:tRNA (guanine37-N1)-methyltransferase
LVAGEKRTVTVHRENGCVFHIDLSGVHFSPRLANERRLVAESVMPGERVLNMFGGLGTFSVEIAKEDPSTVVFNIDINPEAIRLCLKNVLVNHLRGRVVTVLGDAKEASNTLFLGKMDRVLLPLPEKSHEYLDVAVSTLRHCGTVHCYDFVSVDKRKFCVNAALEKVIGLPIKGELLLRGGRVVKSVAPKRYLASLELQVRETANLA